MLQHANLVSCGNTCMVWLCGTEFSRCGVLEGEPKPKAEDRKGAPRRPAYLGNAQRSIAQAMKAAVDAFMPRLAVGALERTTHVATDLGQRRCMSDVTAPPDQASPAAMASVKASFARSIAQVTRGDPSNAFSVLPAIVDLVVDSIPKAVNAVAVTSINEEALWASAAGEAFAANRKGALPQADLVFSVDASQIYQVMLFLSMHAQLQFNTLVEMTAVDYPERTSSRFEVTYVLHSPMLNTRIIVKAMVDELTPIESVVPIFANANWLERETWDMFGVFFKNHPDLRRLLTDYGFTHHPLRKDFPVQGYTEVFYSEARKAVTTRSVQLAQTQRVVAGQS